VNRHFTPPRATMSATSDASATARAPLEGAKPLEDVDVVDLLRRAYTTKELQAQYADALGRKTTCHNKTWILEKIGERASLREHAAALMPDIRRRFRKGIPPVNVPRGRAKKARKRVKKVKRAGEYSAGGVPRRADAEPAPVNPETSTSCCTRTDGKGWRCRRPTIDGTKHCALHALRGVRKPLRRLDGGDGSPETVPASVTATFAPQTPDASFARAVNQQVCAVLTNPSFTASGVPARVKSESSSSSVVSHPPPRDGDSLADLSATSVLVAAEILRALSHGVLTPPPPIHTGDRLYNA